MHTSAKARLTGVAIRIYRHHNLIISFVYWPVLSTFPENLMEVQKVLCKVANRQTNNDEAYLRAKFHLDPSNRLVTIHQRHRQDRADNGVIACMYVSFRQVSSLLWTHTLRPFYSRPRCVNPGGQEFG